jgi:hypothetical protein
MKEAKFKPAGTAAEQVTNLINCDKGVPSRRASVYVYSQHMIYHPTYFFGQTLQIGGNFMKRAPNLIQFHTLLSPVLKGHCKPKLKDINVGDPTFEEVFKNCIRRLFLLRWDKEAENA